jgi:transposase
MPYIKGADRGQVTLMPDCLDDYISDENPVRVIDAFINSLDIEELGIKAESAVEGRRDMIHAICSSCTYTGA